MNKESRIFFNIGLGITAILFIIDFLIKRLPDYIYIPVALVGIIFMIIGFIKDKKSRNEK